MEHLTPVKIVIDMGEPEMELVALDAARHGMEGQQHRMLWAEKGSEKVLKSLACDMPEVTMKLTGMDSSLLEAEPDPMKQHCLVVN